jgi:hemerythrin-like domain-containing protein
MNALELLIGDHNRVKGLFARFEEAHEKEDEAKQQALASKIVQELQVHMELEETIFYPAVEDVKEKVHDLVVEGEEEHGVAKSLMAEASSLDPSDEHWAAKVKVLQEAIDHHVEEEESEMFPKIRSALRAEQLESLGEKLDAGKGRLGAPTLAATVDLTKAELDELAKAQEIPGRSKMSKDELAASVSPK